MEDNVNAIIVGIAGDTSCCCMVCCLSPLKNLPDALDADTLHQAISFQDHDVIHDATRSPGASLLHR